jgi:hypothetical protein
MQTALRSNSMQGLRVRHQTPQHAFHPVLQSAAVPTRRGHHCPQQQQQQQQQQQRCVYAKAYQFKQGPDPADKVLAAIPYLLPLLDALPNGESTGCGRVQATVTKLIVPTSCITSARLRHGFGICRSVYLLGLPIRGAGDGTPCTSCTPVQRHPIRTVSLQLSG